MLLAFVGTGMLAAAGQAGAHPLGNFSVNVHAGLAVGPDDVVVDYVVDLAEIATVQAQPFMDRDGDGRVTDAERDHYGAAGCARWADEVEVRDAGEAVSLAVEEVRTRSDAGEAGLPVLRIECRLEGARPGGSGTRTVTLVDGSFSDRPGWREVTAVGDGARLVDSDVPSRSLSARLQDYPRDRLDDPLDRRQARVVVAAAGGPDGADAPDVVGAMPAALDLGLTGRLDRLVADRLSGPGLLGVGALAAVALGGLHALAPGHGKTVVAAYLIGQRGSLPHAGALAISVALIHTVGVLVLGALLWSAAVTAPERLYRPLGVASGAVIAGLGLLLLRRSRGPSHQHHHHHDGQVTATPPLRVGSVVALGFASGLVPTPSALLVLVSALAAGQVWVGILLVGSYGVGMAVALVGVGLALAVGQRRLVDRLEHLRLGRLHAVSHALPSVTAALVVLAGVGVMARAALAA